MSDAPEPDEPEADEPEPPEGDDAPEGDDEAAPRPTGWRRALRILRVIGRGLAILVAVIVVLVLVILWVPGASQWTVATALSRWDASIPGRVRWSSIDGSLGAGLTIEGLRIEDRHGGALVEAESLAIDVDPGRLLRGQLKVASIHARALDVHVDHDWGDLSPPPKPKKPKKPDEPKPKPGPKRYGPDLPLSIVADLTIERGRVLQAGGPLVELDRLEAGAQGRGRTAQLQMTVEDVALPIADTRVDRLMLDIAWRDPVAELHALEIDAPLASVRTSQARLDVGSLESAVALTIEGDAEALAEFIDLRGRAPTVRTPERLAIDVRAGIDRRDGEDGEDGEGAGLGGEAGLDVSLAVDVDLGGEGQLSLTAGATVPAKSPELSAELGVAGHLAPGLIHPRHGRLNLGISASAERGVDTPVELQADISILDHDTPEQIWARARAAVVTVIPPVLEGAIELRAVGVEASGSVSYDDVPSAELRVDVADLRRPLALVAQLLDQPALAEVGGGVALRASCRIPEGGAEIADWRCPVALDVDRFSGFGVRLAALDLDATVEPLAEVIGFDAALVADGLAAPGDLQFARVRAQAGGTPESLRAEASGTGANDDFRVALAMREIPGGRRFEVDVLEARTRRAAAPVGLRLLHPVGVEWMGDHLFLERTDLELAGARVVAGGRVGLSPTARHDASLRVAGLDLARVDALVPGPSMRGQVDLDAQVAGPLANLRGSLALDGRELQIAGAKLGTLRVRAARGRAIRPAAQPVQPAFVDPRPADGGIDSAASGRRASDLEVTLDLEGGFARRVELVARVPIRGLAIGDGPLDVRAAVERFDPTSLAAVFPETPSWWDPTGPASAPAGSPRWIPEGRVDLDLAVTGTTRSPVGSLAIRGTKLRLDRARLGSFWVRGRLDRDGVGVELNWHPTFATAIGVRGYAPMRIDFANEQVRWRPNEQHMASLDVSGLDVDALRRSLGPSIPALGDALAAADFDRGEFAARVRLSGTAREPRFESQVRARDLHRGGDSLGDVRLAVSYAGETAVADLRVHTPGAERLDAYAEIGVRIDPLAKRVHDLGVDTPVSAHVRAASVALEHAVPGGGVSGLANVRLDAEGTLGAPRADAVVRLLGVEVDRTEVGDLELRAELEPGRAGVEVDVVHDGQHILALAAAVPVDVGIAGVAWDRDGSHQVLVTAREVQWPLIAAVAGLPSDLHGEANLDVHGGGSATAFRLDGRLDASVGKGDAAAMAIAGELWADAEHQHLGLELEPPKGSGLEATADLALAVGPWLAGRRSLVDATFDARVHAPAFELDNLAGLAPTSIHDLQGTLQAEATASGTLLAPELRGELAVHEGAVTVVPLRQRLHDIEVDLALTGDRVELTTLSMAAGRGALKANGGATVHRGQGVDARVEFALDELPVIRPGIPAMTLDAGIDVDLRYRRESTRLAVVLRDPELTVGTRSASAPKSVPKTSAIVFESRESFDAPVETEPTIRHTRDDGRLELSLQLADPLLITGPAVDMAWEGEVDIVRDGASLQVGGRLDTRRGRLELAGAQFDIQRGSVILPDDGTLDPFLDLIAVTDVGEYRITATVRGRVSRPELQFSSSPALDEYEIFALLVTGSTEIGDVDQGAVEAKAAALLAAVSSPRLQQSISQHLYIDRAKLGFGDSVDQPILTVGKRVTRDVYVETSYHHNAPDDENTAEVRVEYDFAKRWSLESYFGDAAVGGLGVYWSRALGPIPWRVSSKRREADRAERRQRSRGED